MISPSLVKKIEEAGLDIELVNQRVAQALAEDAHAGDLTSKATIAEDQVSKANFVARKSGVVAGTLIAATRFLLDKGATDITIICILAAPEGVAALEKALDGAPVTVVMGALDERLNEHGYIVPGLGDAGDRLYGIAQ